VTNETYGSGELDNSNRLVKYDNPHCLGGPNDQDVLSWSNGPYGLGWPYDINESSGPNDPNGTDDLDELGCLEDRDGTN